MLTGAGSGDYVFERVLLAAEPFFHLVLVIWALRRQSLNRQAIEKPFINAVAGELISHTWQLLLLIQPVLSSILTILFQHLCITIYIAALKIFFVDHPDMHFAIRDRLNKTSACAVAVFK